MKDLIASLEKECRVLVINSTTFIVCADLAFLKKDALSTLVGLQDVIVEHLLKLYLFPRSTDAPAWRKELATWKAKLERRNRSKMPSKKNFTKSLLMKHLWYDPVEDNLDVWLTQMRDKGFKIYKVDELKFKIFVEKYVDSIKI